MTDISNPHTKALAAQGLNYEGGSLIFVVYGRQNVLFTMHNLVKVLLSIHE